MANPASGTITLAGIYNEGIAGGCVADAVSNFSLSACATGYGIATDPDAMSEFYSKACPTANYTVYVYITFADDPYLEDLANYAIYYTLNNGADVTLEKFDNLGGTWEDCNGAFTFVVSSGTYVTIGLKKTDNTNGISFFGEVLPSPGCSSCGDIYCGTENVGLNPLVVGTITSDTYVGLCPAVKGGEFALC